MNRRVSRLGAAPNLAGIPWMSLVTGVNGRHSLNWMEARMRGSPTRMIGILQDRDARHRGRQLLQQRQPLSAHRIFIKVGELGRKHPESYVICVFSPRRVLFRVGSPALAASISAS